MCGLEKREQLDRPQRSLVFAFLGFEETLGPLAPARRLAVEVDQVIVIADQMIGQSRDDLSDVRLLRFVRHQIEVERVAVVMPHDFVRAGVTFPKPFAIGRGVPLPFRGPGLVDRDERARRKTGDARDFFEPDQQPHGTLRLRTSIRIFRHRVAIRLRTEIHRRPQAVVVVVRRDVAGEIARHAQA